MGHGREVEYKLILSGADQFEHQIDHLQEMVHELAAAFLVFEGAEFFKGAAESFVEMQKSAQMLKFAVGANGGLTSDLEALREESEKLEGVGIFSHVKTMEAERRLLNFGASVKQVRDGMKDIESAAAAATGGDLEGTVNAVAMAAAGGREMALKQYGLGFLDLEKDMSKSGAEARNFTKIISAMQEKFKGGLEDIATNTEFGKIEQFKNKFEGFKETLGKELMEAFDKMLPTINKFIDILGNALGWIVDNANALKNMAITVVSIAVGFKLLKTGMAIFQAIKTMIQSLTFATMAWGEAQVTASMAMSVTPWGAVAAAVGILIGGFAALSGAQDDYNARQEKLKKDTENSWIEEEHKKIEDLIDEYIKLHHVTEDVARLKVIQSEIAENDITKNESSLDKALGIGTHTVQFSDKQKALYADLKKTKDELDRQGLRSGQRGAPGKAGDNASQVSGTKQVIINVTINKLVELLKIEAKNIKDGLSSVVPDVAKALSASVNQFSASQDI